MSGSAGQAVKSAARALDLLDEIVAGGPGTQQQLGHRVGIPKSSMHALMRTMVDRGWVETDPTGTVYRLGVRSLVVRSAFLDSDPAVAGAQPYIDELSTITGETVHLGRLVEEDIIYIAKRESVHPLRMFSAVGRRLPACVTALGRAALSIQAPELREASIPAEIHSLTPRTTTARVDLLSAIEEAAQVGYAVETEESCMGVRCFAVPVAFTPSAADALGLAVPLSRLDDDREALIVEALLGIRARVEDEGRFLRRT